MTYKVTYTDCDIIPKKNRRGQLSLYNCGFEVSEELFLFAEADVN